MITRYMYEYLLTYIPGTQTIYEYRCGRPFLLCCRHSVLVTLSLPGACYSLVAGTDGGTDGRTKIDGIDRCTINHKKN